MSQTGVRRPIVAKTIRRTAEHCSVGDENGTITDTAQNSRHESIFMLIAASACGITSSPDWIGVKPKPT